jgi:glycosyltransferase involved in cell wall biosynthesis
MAKISAVINTRNEERNLRYCLESVKWCDEIVVVDMESDDNTVDIAREYTGKIYRHEKVQAFDIARKFAVEMATGDWILLIDADELIPATLRERLLEFAGDDTVDVLFLPRKDYIMGAWIKSNGFWPDYLPRFFRRNAISFTEHVHDFMHIAKTARIRYLPPKEELSIEHFAYLDSAHFMEKLNRYTTLEAQHLFERGSRFSLRKMLYVVVKEFYFKFFKSRAYREGLRGFFISIMMCFYRILTYIKLWEKRENQDGPVVEKYDDLKRQILRDYTGR